MGCTACHEHKKKSKNKNIGKNNEKVDITDITNEDYKNNIYRSCRIDSDAFKKKVEIVLDKRVKIKENDGKKNNKEFFDKHKEDNENHENKNGLNINIDKNKIDNLKIEGDIVNEGTNSKISLKLMNGYENTNELVPSQSINQTSTLIAGSGTNTKVLSNYYNINNFQPKNSENPHVGNDIDGIINE